jgi:hypothetical protein
MYGFTRLAHGPDKGAYYSLAFLRGHPALVRHMVRRKIKGTKVRKTPVDEPDFYHKAWEAHVEATIPASLQTRAVTPAEHAMVVPVAAPRVKSSASSRLVNLVPVTRSRPKRVTVTDSEETSWETGVESSVDGLEDVLEAKVSIAWQNIPIYEDPFEPTPIRETPSMYNPAFFF